MKALVLHAIGDLKYEDVQVPKAEKGEVLLKIRASGICGSDIQRVFEKGTYHFPTIPGHEFAGEIVAIGKDVSNDYIGKKAAVFPLLPCMKCDACQVGQYAQCQHYNYFGSRCDGGFAEYISIPVWNLVIVPDEISFEEAAICEPSAVAIHALRQAGIDIGDQVAIFGAGPIGLMLGQWAKAWGADKVMLIDIDEYKIEFAKKQGFRYVCNSRSDEPLNWIKELTDGRGADLCLEGAGVSQTLDMAMFAARTFGRVVCMGNPASDMRLSQKGYWEILRKQLTIKGTWNSSFSALYKNEWDLSIRAMQTGKLNVKPFVTHKVPLSEGVKTFKMMKDRNEFFNKVMFVME